MPAIKIKNNGVWQNIGGTPDLSSISISELGGITVDLNDNNYGTPPALLGFIRIDIDGVLLANNWSAEAPYTQSITVDGISFTDRPILELDTSTATAETIGGLEENYSYIKNIKTSLNTITFTCFKNKPTIDLPVTGQTIRAGAVEYENAVGVEF